LGFTKKTTFAILGVVAPEGQVEKKKEYLDIPNFRHAAGQDESTLKMLSHL
jgi:hypothetical protein